MRCAYWPVPLNPASRAQNPSGVRFNLALLGQPDYAYPQVLLARITAMLGTDIQPELTRLTPSVSTAFIAPTANAESFPAHGQSTC